MGYKSILTKIDELREIVSSWRDGEEPALLDKDMALERVKSIYEMLRFPVAEVASEVASETDVASETEPEVVSERETERETGVECETENEIEAEVEIEAEAEAEDVESSVSLDEDISLELVNITQLIDEALEDGGDMIDRETFVKEIEAVNQKKRERLNKILSLYDDDCDLAAAAPYEPEPETELQPEPEVELETDPETDPEFEQEGVEGEMEIEQELQSAEPERECAETEQQPEQKQQSAEPVQECVESEQSEQAEASIAECSLPHSILSLLSINDRILLSQELFAGDDELLNETLVILESQSTFDDAMIYIAERYMWSGDNEGAQLLMTLLQNRYQN